MRADAGIVISASHNTYQYNGIKIFDRHGYKLPDSKELEVKEIMHSEELDRFRPTMEQIGRAARIDDAIGRYIVYIKDTFPQDLTLDGIRIVLDCAHGAKPTRWFAVVFQELGAEVFPMNVAPNGRNINDQCGAVYPQAMCRSVHEHRAEDRYRARRRCRPFDSERRDRRSGRRQSVTRSARSTCSRLER